METKVDLLLVVFLYWIPAISQIVYYFFYKTRFETVGGILWRIVVAVVPIVNFMAFFLRIIPFAIDERDKPLIDTIRVGEAENVCADKDNEDDEKIINWITPFDWIFVFLAIVIVRLIMTIIKILHIKVRNR